MKSDTPLIVFGYKIFHELPAGNAATYKMKIGSNRENKDGHEV